MKHDRKNFVNGSIRESGPIAFMRNMIVAVILLVGVAVNVSSAIAGFTWTERKDASSRKWSSIGASSDGTKIAAAVWNGGYIYTSTDSGVTWKERTSGGNRSWISIVSSSDGSKLAAAAENGYIYTSTSSGAATWTEQTGSGLGSWRAMVSSSDGTQLYVIFNSEQNIYASTDSGSDLGRADKLRKTQLDRHYHVLRRDEAGRCCLWGRYLQVDEFRGDLDIDYGQQQQLSSMEIHYLVFRWG